MPTIDETKAWLADRAQKDDELYERYGRPLEADHAGEFVAISDEGEVALGSDVSSLLQEVVDRFSESPFALRRFGADFVLRYRSPRLVDRNGDGRVPTLREIQERMAERAKQDDELYDRFGQPLEADHVGEFVAISDNGEFILGTDRLALDDEALRRFGPGKYAFRKIGVKAEIHLRTAR